MNDNGMVKLREIVDSKLEFDAAYFKVVHPEVNGYLCPSSPEITSVDEMLPNLMDLSLKSYRFSYVDYCLNIGYDVLSVLYLYFSPTDDHSTNIDGDFIDLVSHIRFLKAP